MKTLHKFNVFYPLNIYVGRIAKIKSFLHFLSYAIGISDILKQVDKELKEYKDKEEVN